MAASPPTLFIVDDDQGLLRLASRSLTRQGYAVQTAASAPEAMDWLKVNEPDLVLLDLKLHELGAKEVLAEVAKQKKMPPFVIITGQGDERVAVEMMKSGALDYLVKGKDFLDFLPSVVSRVLAHIAKEKKLAEAEEALKTSEERFRVALKHSPITVFQQDSELRYTWIQNQPLNQPEKAVIGKTDADLYPEEAADRLIQIKARVMATGTGLRQETAWTVDGVKHYFDLTVEPVRDFSGQITGITCAALDITDRKRLEQEVLQISEVEQRRIGQDLHDGICQHLAGIEMKSQVLEQNLAKNKAAAAQAGQIAGHVREVIAQTRSLARGLSPFILESEGLVSALTELAANTEKMFLIKCHFKNTAQTFPEEVKVTTHLYRIAQEAVTNAVKHGQAKNIEISLAEQADKLTLTIRDDGRGFAAQPKSDQGMGLRIMRYRAGMIGANVLFQAAPGRGVTIVCFLPLK